MATVPMVVAVRCNAWGDVLEVRRGIVDTAKNAWTPNGSPVPVHVIEIVNAIMAGDAVWSRLPHGAPGPVFKVVVARGGHGVETIELDDPELTVADLAQF